MNPPKHKIRSGFTLLEFIVVLAILMLMIGMLMPALQRIRSLTAKVNCASNMRQIGVAIHGYIEAHGRYPKAARVPSQMPGQPILVEVLSRFVEDNEAIFRCPSDSEFFAREGLSYEYFGYHLSFTSYVEPSHNVPLLADLSHFHGPPNTHRSRNVLYGDGRVQ